MATERGVHVQPGRTVTDFVSFPDLAPTLMEIVGLKPRSQMTGQSFTKQLFAKRSGRIDAARDHTLLGKERHDIGRTDGERLSVAYPSRAIRADQYLYVHNFKPDRWPGGNPEYGFMNCDGSPTKTFLTKLKKGDADYHFFEMSFGKRPEEELYDILNDPDCVKNLAGSSEFSEIKTRLWHQLKTRLTSQQDPRILGNGDIFDFYPNCRIDRQQKLYKKPDYEPVEVFEAEYGNRKSANDK